MGEAKRKRTIAAATPCRCGSGKLAPECCLKAGNWFKVPAFIQLSAGTDRDSLPRCYLRHLNTCSDKLSAEHLISEAVLRVIATDKLTFSGLPWLKGEQRSIGLASLTSNCLCTKHNSALSDLDAAAARFFEAIKSCDLQRIGTGNAAVFRRLFCNDDQLSPLHSLPKIVTKQMGAMVFVLRSPDLDGASAFFDGVPFAFVSARFPPRMLFTLAHECAHLVAHHDPAESFAVIDETTDTEGVGGPKKGEERYPSHEICWSHQLPSSNSTWHRRCSHLGYSKCSK
jgi:hypothetical protein